MVLDCGCKQPAFLYKDKCKENAALLLEHKLGKQRFLCRAWFSVNLRTSTPFGEGVWVFLDNANSTEVFSV